MKKWRFVIMGALMAAAVCLVAACSGSDSPAITPTVEATQTATAVPPTPTPPLPTATPVRPDANPFPDDLRQSSLEYLEQIAQLRNTPIKNEVDMFSLSREQARAYYSQPDPGSGAGSGGNTGARPIDVKQEVYEIFNLVPEQRPSTGSEPAQPSLQESQIDNLISLITGFYSPDLNALYILETINGGIYGSLARSTIVHELVHGLQYQYTDLDGIAAERANNWDARTALLSVIEGEAVYTEIELLGFSTRSTYRQPVCFTIPAPQRSGTPYVVERELDTWYEDGLCFIQAISAERTIDTLFQNLPTTMEQILHPEKYLAGEQAISVTLPDASSSLGTGWSKAGSGVLGEFMLQNILLAGLPADRARIQEAAAGWGGDAWTLYTNNDHRVLQASITWDTTEDADQFWQVLLDVLIAHGASAVDPSTSTFDVTAGKTTWRGSIAGSTTSLVLTTDPSVTLPPRATQ